MGQPVDAGDFVGVELYLLVERTAQRMHHPTLDRAAQPLGVDDQATVVRAYEPLHPDVTRVTIDLDLGNLRDDRLATEGVRDSASRQNGPCTARLRRRPRVPAVGIRGRTDGGNRAGAFEATVIVGAPLSSFSRNSTGSAWAAAASSSMNDSEAKVTCGPLQDP